MTTNPLSHTGSSVAYLIHGGQDVINELVYYMGDPKRIGIVRDVKVVSGWRSEVLVEWQSGKKVWKYAGPIITIDSKIKEERNVLDTLLRAREEAEQHFGTRGLKW